jgi:hypothetical protein
MISGPIVVAPLTNAASSALSARITWVREMPCE